MKKQNRSVPIHLLKDRTDKGFDLQYVDEVFQSKHKPIIEAHRDDHYMFILLEEGHVSFMIDFKLFGITAPALVMILPGQVHYFVSASAVKGWVFGIDPTLISGNFRNTLEEQLFSDPLSLEEGEMGLCANTLSLTKQYLDSTCEQGAFQKDIIQSLVGVFSGIVTELYSKKLQCCFKGNPRQLTILLNFRKLLASHYKQWKKPSVYADLMHLSPSYLNEMIKSATGFSVSYWIRNEVITEAKRLLYYSDMTVKEIAHLLGYDDHTYFIRLFTKEAALAPGQFRKKYRE